MNRGRCVWLGVFASLAFVAAGCSGGSNSSTDSGSTPGSPSAAESKKSESARMLVIPAGTELTVRLETALGSKSSNEGDPFEASLAEPVMLGDKIVIQKGASASGTVTQAHAAGKFKGGATLGLVLKSIAIDGQPHAVETSSVVEATKGKGKRSAALIGGGAAGGAILGGLLGGGKGAVIGAAAGGGAGTAGAAYTGDRDISLPVETLLRFKLASDLTIKGK
jgi:hypothetical protein